MVSSREHHFQDFCLMHVVRHHVLLLITCHPTLYVHASPGDRHRIGGLLNKQGSLSTLQYADILL